MSSLAAAQRNIHGATEALLHVVRVGNHDTAGIIGERGRTGGGIGHPRDGPIVATRDRERLGIRDPKARLFLETSADVRSTIGTSNAALVGRSASSETWEPGVIDQ